MKDIAVFNDDFYKENPVLSPKALVVWKKENGLYNFNKLPKVAILSIINCFSKKELFFTKKIKGLNADIYCFNKVLLALNIGIGAPAIIALLEELKVLGVEKFIFIGYAGRIINTINSGEIVTVSEAFTLNGSSVFYTKAAFISNKNNFQIKIAAKYHLKEVKTISVDSPFRETKSLLKYYKDKNATLVDMETASILAFANFHQVPVCTILVASDLLLPEWQAPKNTNNTQKRIKNLIIKLSKSF